MGVCLEEEINFGLGGIEAEVFVSEVEAPDLGVVVPDGAFDIGVGFPLEFRVGSVNKDWSLALGNGGKFARDVVPAFLIGWPPSVADGDGAEGFGFSGGRFVGKCGNGERCREGIGVGDQVFAQLEIDELADAAQGDRRMLFHGRMGGSIQGMVREC